MMSKFVFSNLLLASAALAAPSSQQGTRLARHQENYQSQPVDSVASSARAASNILDLNQDLAGAVVSQDNRTFATVIATFAVPTLTGGGDNKFGNGTSGFSIWVAIDGYTCRNGLLAGIEANFIDGVPGPYNAWYKLQPGYTRDSGYASLNISSMPINGSDVVTVTVTATYGGTGDVDGDRYIVLIENQTTGQAIDRELNVPSDSEFALCGRDVQWGVGKFQGTDGSPPLANFGIVTFTNAIATGINANGNDYNPLNATNLRDIAQLQGGDVIISTYVSTGRDSLVVQYLSGD